MCKKVKFIDAPLCESCADLLGKYFVTEEKEETDAACPWCERAGAAAIYRIVFQ